MFPFSKLEARTLTQQLLVASQLLQLILLVASTSLVLMALGKLEKPLGMVWILVAGCIAALGVVEGFVLQPVPTPLPLALLRSTRRDLLCSLSNSAINILLAEQACASSTLPVTFRTRTDDCQLHSLVNPSGTTQTDDQGFLSGNYFRVNRGYAERLASLPAMIQNYVQVNTGYAEHLESLPVRIRNVPGDGSCLFHATVTSFAQVVHGRHLVHPDDAEWLFAGSATLRKIAIERLRQENQRIHIAGNAHVNAGSLVEAVAAQHGMSPTDHFNAMEHDTFEGDEHSAWGGGPEIVALSNLMKRPIRVYKLATATKKGSSFFVLELLTSLGSPKFDDKEALHVLTADSRFPDVSPGDQMNKPSHFLAVLPQPDIRPRIY